MSRYRRQPHHEGFEGCRGFSRFASQGSRHSLSRGGPVKTGPASLCMLKSIAKPAGETL